MIIGFPHVALAWKQQEVPLQEKIAELMIKSCREKMPGTPIVQFTSQYTTPVPGTDSVVVKPWVRGMSWLPYMCSFLSEIDDEVVFLDTDVIVCKDLRRMLVPGADMVITVRGKPVTAEDGTSMMVLLGVCASRNKEVWRVLGERVSKMRREMDRNWWGVQLTLWDMLQESLRGESPFKIRAVRQWQFNYVPKDADDAPEDVWAIHYKGEHRKQWMVRKWGHTSTAVTTATAR